MSLPKQKSRFDNTGPGQAPLTAAFATVVRQALAQHARDLRVCVPARVIAVGNDYVVDLQPLLLERHAAGITPMPILPGVPVSMPTGAKFSLRYPLTIGDTGYVLIADRSLDSWLAGDGSAADPADPRTHDLTDAIFVPGLLTTSQAQASTTGSSDLVLTAGAAQLRLEQAGRFRVTNGAVELVDLVQQLATQVAALAAFATSALDSFGKPITSPNAAATAKVGTAAGGGVATQLNTLKG